ncbi:MAG: hypothetical protein DME57_10265 [Verrucomicrobia bacterium]|nr:MAG: hypothetical protein DME57_10265 [Verrucomicrobiota bacterium]
MPIDKHATVIAVILLVFPVFILPLEVECPSPTGWVVHAETGSYGQKASLITTNTSARYSSAIVVRNLGAPKSFV